VLLAFLYSQAECLHTDRSLHSEIGMGLLSLHRARASPRSAESLLRAPDHQLPVIEQGCPTGRQRLRAAARLRSKNPVCSQRFVDQSAKIRNLGISNASNVHLDRLSRFNGGWLIAIERRILDTGVAKQFSQTLDRKTGFRLE